MSYGISTYPAGVADVAISPDSSFGAFGRLRVAEPHTLFDSKQIHNNQALFWDDQAVSGASTTSSWSQDTASTTIGVGATTAGKRVRQTFRRFNYQPGKSQLFLMTGTLDASGGGTGITRGFGCFDDSNGVFLQDNEGTLQFVIRSSTSGSPVDNAVSQSSWNTDKMDGTGPSGATLDVTKSQILFIDFEWLGVGTVRMGFVINGEFIICHKFHHANAVVGVYMSTPNLPLRYEIDNDGTGAASTLEHICSTVISEGGVQDVGPIRYFSNQTTAVVAAASGTKYALCGLRLNASRLDGVVQLVNKTVLETNAVDYEWQVIFNPTIAGTAPTFSALTNSVVDTAVGVAANTVTGGTIIAGGYVKGGKESGESTTGLDTSLVLGASISGTQDEVWLVARPLAINADFLGSLAWREIS